MKLHLAWILVVAGGCAQGGWNTVPNPFAQSAGPRQAKKLDAKTASKMSLARLSERHGQADSARDIYKVILRKYPNLQAAHHRIGIVYARQSQFKDAEHHLSKALELGPTTPELLTDVGYLYYLQDRLGDAEATYRRALEINPNHKPAHNNLAIALGEQGRYDDSLKEFRLAVNEAQAIANLAFIQSQAGDEELATQNYHRALALDSNVKPAAEALVQMAARQRGSNGRPNIKVASFARRPIERLPDTNQQGRPNGQAANGSRQTRPLSGAPNGAAIKRPQNGPPQNRTGFTVSDQGVSPQGISNPPTLNSWQRPTWSPR